MICPVMSKYYIMSWFTSVVIAILLCIVAALAQLHMHDLPDSFPDRSSHVRKSTTIHQMLSAVLYAKVEKTQLLAEEAQPINNKIEASAELIANPWPQEFAINFTTKNGSAWGWLAYDWSSKQQLIAHGPGSTECETYEVQDTCLLLFDPQGTYAILPTVKRCWLDIAGVGSVPPEWTTTGVYVDTRIVEGVGLCRAFAFPPTPHLYLETVPGGLPCGFVFPVPSMSYVFLPSTLVVGNPGSQYFDLPDYCSEKSADV
ncbi:hypothetical protein O6H91_07G108300 [Diphasiastrum complanatum]|uniref:Uncharacterized protein n=1 Tax=Diphasiastrum complanatum TaxID=34168 RepID=A0ACC2D8Q8_DIPCM|nr:hypothetical protein O6H91_07G108300 [Diphasiastrum complanatum]